MSDSNYHTKTNSQSVRKLNFEDENSPLVIAEQPEPISIDSNDKIHANVEEEVIPKLGIEFEIEQDAYDFYNSYALVVGFSIRQSKGHMGDKDGSHKWLDRVFFFALARVYEGITKEMIMWNDIVQKQDVVAEQRWKSVVDIVKNIVW